MFVIVILIAIVIFSLIVSSFVIFASVFTGAVSSRWITLGVVLFTLGFSLLMFSKYLI